MILKASIGMLWIKMALYHRYGNSNNSRVHSNGDTSQNRGVPVPKEVKSRFIQMKKMDFLKTAEREVMMEKFFKLSITTSHDSEYLFCNCIFLFGEITLGDHEQTVLANTLSLSLKDLISRLSADNIFCCDGNIEDTFDYLSDNINNSCLPTYVEPFDGDFGLFFRIDNENFLVLRLWNKSDLLKVRLNKDDYIQEISSTLKKLDIAIDEYERKWQGV